MMRSRWNKRNSKRRSVRNRQESRLHLEALEDRTLPSADFGYALSFGGTGSDEVISVATDQAGDIYLTGTENGSGFVSHYAADGTFVWSRSLPGDLGIDLAVDAERNSYVASRNNTAGQVSRIDQHGNTLWTTVLAGNRTTQTNGIAVDADGNVYAAGGFSGTTSFGSFQLTAEGVDDSFVIKLNSSGSVLWAKRFGGAGRDDARDVAVDADGNVYFANTHNMTEDGSDLAVTKLDNNGSILWDKRFLVRSDDTNTGNTRSFAAGLALDSDGNVWATGGFAGTVDFDPGAEVHELTAHAGPSDGFLLKLSAAGEYRGAWHVGGERADIIGDVVVDGAGFVYVSGDFVGPADFDPGPETVDVSSSAGAFLAKFDNNGSFLGAWGWGNPTSNPEPTENGLGVALGEAGSVYVGGRFRTTVDFDPGSGSENVFNLTSAGETDAFLVQLLVGSLPTVSLSNAEIVEADSGTVQVEFTVTLSEAGIEPITVSFTTVDDTAIAGSDYEASSGQLTFQPDGPLTQTITVAITPDRFDESNETFFLNLTGVSDNATIADSQGVGTIIDDDTSLFVLTHGLNGFPFGPTFEFEPWLYDIATAINRRVGYGFSRSEIEQSRLDVFDPLQLPDNSAANFLLFDWTFHSTTPGSADSVFVAGQLARQVAQRINDLENGDGGIDIHFIGHSRGCFVNAEAIRQLKLMGAESDIDFLQVTTLDPQKFGPDGLLEANPGGIVDFADNYYQQTKGKLEPAGIPILGALNVNLSTILDAWKDGRSGPFKEHSEVHDWYHWTIDTDDTSMGPIYRDEELHRQQHQFFSERADPATRDLLFASIDLDGDKIAESFERGEAIGFYWSIAGQGIDSRPLVLRDIQFDFSDPKEKILSKVELYFNRGDINWISTGVQLSVKQGAAIPLKPVDFQFDSTRQVLTIDLTDYDLSARVNYKLSLTTQNFSVQDQPDNRLVDDDSARNGILGFNLNPKKKTFGWR